MILFALLQRLFALTSVLILALGVWLVWSWREAELEADALGLADPGEERLWWGVGLLAWSVLGRIPVLLLLGGRGGAEGTRRPEGTRLTGSGEPPLWLSRSGGAEGPVIVMTHAWGMTSRIWGGVRTGLEANFGVLVWDLPGAGKSARLKGGYTLERLADRLAEVLDAVEPGRPVVLLGHSIGGMTALTLCARRPDLLTSGRVAGLVLMNTTHRDPLNTMVFSGLFTALEPLIKALSRMDVVTSPLLRLVNWQSYLSGGTHLAMRIAGFGARPSRAMLDLAARLPTQTSPAVQAEGNLAMIRWRVTDRLGAIDAPALVLVGGRDLVTKDHAGETIASELPRARLVRIPDAGHMGPQERTDAYVEAVTAFVRSDARA
ncbi:MAG: alpha/beta fold hydrolase [Brevundimonas sp.]